VTPGTSVSAKLTAPVAFWLVIEPEFPGVPALQPASDAYPQKAKANIDILPIVLVIVVLRTAVLEIDTRNTRGSARPCIKSQAKSRSARVRSARAA
jgi:hypothetical protein